MTDKLIFTLHHIAVDWFMFGWFVLKDLQEVLESLQEPLSAPDQQLKRSTMAQVGGAELPVLWVGWSFQLLCVVAS